MAKSKKSIYRDRSYEMSNAPTSVYWGRSEDIEVELCPNGKNLGGGSCEKAYASDLRSELLHTP